MKDIDFDELDKAVSSVLSTTATPSTTEATVSEPAVTVTAPAEVTDSTDDAITSDPVMNSPVSEPEEPVTPATPAVSSTPAAKPNLGNRRRGQFMDLVPQSGDKKSREVLPPKERLALSPVARDVKPEPASAAPIVDEAPKNQWPDPLDSMSTDTKKDSPTDEPEEPEVKADEPDVTPVVSSPGSYGAGSFTSAMSAEAETSSTTHSSDTTDTQTPFLADAKVDKRPLGGATDDGPKLDTIDAEKWSGGGASEEHVPPELHPDVVAVESQTIDEAESEDLPAEETKPVESPWSKPYSTPSPAVIKEDAEPVSSESTSIPQQYKIASSPTADISNHPIFDTKEYHQPLLPAKNESPKKRVWVVVIVIVVLLLLGAGVGYAAFTFGF